MHADGPIDAPHMVFDVNELQQFLAAQHPSKPPPPPPAPPPAAAAPPSPPPAKAPTAAAPSPSDQDARQRLNRILKELFPQP
jgi:hypothetical protein